MAGKLKSMSPMQSIFSAVINVLNENKIEHVLVGGLAVNHYGYARGTQDMDFMMVVPDANKVVTIMQKAGFTSYSVQPLVLFFQNPNEPIRVDFLRIDVETFDKIMQSAVSVDIMGCSTKMPSLQTLLAMKFHSLCQFPARGKDFEDIVWLSIFNKVDEASVLYPLAKKYATEAVYQQVCERINHEKSKCIDL